MVGLLIFGLIACFVILVGYSIYRFKCRQSYVQRNYLIQILTDLEEKYDKTTARRKAIELAGKFYSRDEEIIELLRQISLRDPNRLNRTKACLWLSKIDCSNNTTQSSGIIVKFPI